MVTVENPDAGDAMSPFLANTHTTNVPYASPVTVHVRACVVQVSISVPFCFRVTTYEVAFAEAFYETATRLVVPTWTPCTPEGVAGAGSARVTEADPEATDGTSSFLASTQAT